MMPCNDYQALVLDHLYGLLDEAEAAAVDSHLAACPACSAAHSQAAQDQGLFAKAAKSEFPNVKFTAPVEVYAEPKVRDHHFFHSKKKNAQRNWLGWAVAASVLLLIPGTLMPLGKLANRYDGAQQNVENASVRMADARVSFERTKNDTSHQDRVATIRAKQQRAVADWLAAEAADRDRKVSVEVTKPLSALPGAPAEFAVAVSDPMESLRGNQVEASVRDQAGTVLFTQKVDPKIPAAVRLPAAIWTKLAPQSELFLNVSAVNEESGSRTELQEPIRLFGPVYATMLTTDKTTYRPGERLFFRSLTLDRITFQPPSRDQKLQFVLRKQDDPSKIIASVTGSTRLVKESGGEVEPVLDGQGKPIHGVGCGAFLLPANLADGDYTLSLTELAGPGGAPTAIAYPVNRTIKVRSGAPERFAKKITFSAASYAPGPGQIITAFAELKFGDKPVAGAKVNAVIMADDRPVDIVTYVPLSTGKDGKTTPITDADGRSRIEFPVPLLANLPRGHVRLMVTFTHDGVEESVAERVPITGKEIIIEFFPEGGKLIAGVPNRVYVRGTTPAGKPVDVRGTIAAGTEIIAKVETPSNDEPAVPGGLGSFQFTPKSGTVYRLRLPTANPAGLAPTFDLPKAEAEGVVISALDAVIRTDQPIVVRIHSVGKDRNLVIGAYTRGRLADTQKIAVKAGQPALASLASNNSDSRGGVTRITVFEEPADVSGELIPVAERLVFRKPGGILNLSVSAGPQGKVFAPGSPIDLSILATDEKGRGVPAILWAAAVNTAAAPDAKVRSLPTHFLLAGEVQTPDDLEYADFLLTDHPKAAEALDHVLATQGWRRFVEQGRVPAHSGSPVAELLKLHGQFVPAAKQGIRLAGGKHFERYWPQFEDSAAELEAAEKTQQESVPAIGKLFVQYAETHRQAAEYTEAARRAADSLIQMRERLVLAIGGVAMLSTMLGLLALVRRTGLSEASPYFLGTIAAGCLAIYLAYDALEHPVMAPAEPADLLAPPVSEAAPLLKSAALPQVGPETIAPEPISDSKAEPYRLWNMNDPLMVRTNPAAPKSAGVRKAIRDDLLAPRAAKFPVRPPVPQYVLSAYQSEDLATRKTAQEFSDRRATNLLQKLEALGGSIERIRVAIPRTPPLVIREYAAPRAGSNDPAARDADTVLWQPVIVLPTDGKTVLHFNLGNAPGGYQVIVAGHTADGRFGSSRTILPVR